MAKGMLQKYGASTDPSALELRLSAIGGAVSAIGPKRLAHEAVVMDNSPMDGLAA
jgi:hypothetical protein